MQYTEFRQMMQMTWLVDGTVKQENAVLAVWKLMVGLN